MRDETGLTGDETSQSSSSLRLARVFDAALRAPTPTRLRNRSFRNLLSKDLEEEPRHHLAFAAHISGHVAYVQKQFTCSSVIYRKYPLKLSATPQHSWRGVPLRKQNLQQHCASAETSLETISCNDPRAVSVSLARRAMWQP